MMKNKSDTSTEFIEYYKKSKKLRNNDEYWSRVNKLAKDEETELNYIMKGLEHLGLLIN